MDTAEKNNESTNAIDELIETTKKNIGAILKTTPLAIGFTLFLIYFCQNNFFPSFDIFSLGSLLISAFVFGILMFLLIAFGISFPGLLWVDSLLNGKDIKSEIEYFTLKGNSQKEKIKILSIIRRYFAFPNLLCGFTGIYSLIGELSDAWQAATFFGAPLLVSILLAFNFKREFQLPKALTIQAGFVSYLTFLVASVITIGFAVFTVEAHVKDEAEHVKIFTLILVTTLMPVLFSVTALAAVTFNRGHVIFFSSIFSLLMSIFTNMWASLPPAIVKTLGIGNYVADAIYFKDEYCSGEFPPTAEKTDGTCTIKNAKVIWAVGDTYKLTIVKDKTSLDITIPAEYVLAIIKTQRPKDKKTDLQSTNQKPIESPTKS